MLLPQWLMLLPIGTFVLADVIAMGSDVITTQGEWGSLADVKANCGHNVNIDNFTILGREDHSLLRTIKKALYIRANNLSLNRNIGKYHLPHIWDEVLLNISELNLK